MKIFKMSLVAIALLAPALYASDVNMETEEKKSIIILTAKVAELESLVSILMEESEQYKKDKAMALDMYHKDKAAYEKDKSEAIKMYLADKDTARKEREALKKGEGFASGSKSPRLSTADLNSHNTFNPNDLYRVLRYTKAYKNETGKDGRSGRRGSFSKDDIVLVTKVGANRSHVSSGEWVDNKDLEPLGLKKDSNGKYLFDGGFYKTRTYMANARNRPGVKGTEVRAVYYKGSVLWIVEQVPFGGGTWGKISNGNYINMAIIKKLDL